MDLFTQVFLEVSILALFGLAYFIYQRKRIIKAQKWNNEDWETLYQLGLNCTDPENYPLLFDFLDELETIIRSQSYPPTSWFKKWPKDKLPDELTINFPSISNEKK